MTEPSPGSIVILTGAGISKESWLDTFRDLDGIWARVRIEDVATPEAFARDPVRVHDFYNTRRARLASGRVMPNAAHKALARLEAEWPGSVLVVTQNIDDLHERAGSRHVVHMHGELLSALCRACEGWVRWERELLDHPPCPGCGHAELRPDVVWFDEMLPAPRVMRRSPGRASATSRSRTSSRCSSAPPTAR